MATIIFLDLARCRSPNAQASAGNPSATSAKVLMFTGVRRERLCGNTDLPEACRHEPMFDDTAPSKPTGKKRGRSKNA